MTDKIEKSCTNRQAKEKEQEIHRIAVISDTHGLLRPEVIEQLKTCERIFHGGDIGKPEIINQLKAICETYVVRGNVDKSLLLEIGNEIEVELFGFRIYMVHNKKEIRNNLSGVDIVIYGHSHKYEVRELETITYLNPGSCGPRRFRLPVTMMILVFYPFEHRFEIKRVDCLQVQIEKKEKLPGQDMYKLVKNKW